MSLTALQLITTTGESFSCDWRRTEEGGVERSLELSRREEERKTEVES